MGKKLDSCFSNLIKKFDFFTSPVSMRYDKDIYYNTAAGGCFSIIIILILVGVFYNQWIDILSYSNLSANTQTVRQFDPSKLILNTNDFMFTIGIRGLDLNSNDTSYVKLKIQSFWIDENQTTHIQKIPMQPCTVDQWNKFGEGFQQTFDRLKLSTFKCPPSNYSLYFQGKFSSPNFAYIKITVQQCIGVGCKTPTQYNNYFKTMQAFYLNIYYTNVMLNKDLLNAILPVFEDKTYLMTSERLGVNLNVYVSQFQITTDQSLWPWIQNKVQKGVVINKNDNQQWNYNPIGPIMSKIYLRKSDNKVYVTRNFRKIDDMLSYIGGLIGIIIVVMGVFMQYYNQCSFQLALSSDIFQYKSEEQQSNQKEQKQQNQIKQTEQSLKQENQDNQDNKKKDQFKNQKNKDQLDQSSFTLIDYILYIIYLTLKVLGFRPKWKKMIMYDSSLDEIRNQMNINTLICKIMFLNKSVLTLFDDEQLKLLYLQQKQNIIDIKKDRETLDMSYQILNNYSNTLGDYPIQDSIRNDTNFGTNRLMSLNRMISSNQIILGVDHQQNHKSNDHLEVSLKSQLYYQSIKSMRNFDVSPYTMLMSALRKNDNQIPDEIKYALDNLKKKIDSGDIVSKRIYDGLDRYLIEKYQNNNLNISLKKSRPHLIKIQFIQELSDKKRTSIAKSINYQQ